MPTDMVTTKTSPLPPGACAEEGGGFCAYNGDIALLSKKGHVWSILNELGLGTRLKYQVIEMTSLK